MMLSYDSRLYAVLAGFSSLAYASVLWLLTALPVVTAPPATAGLFAAMRSRGTVEDPGVTKAFMRGFWCNVGRSYAVAGICAAGVAAVAFDLLLARQARHPVIVGCIAAAALCAFAVGVNLWPALVATTTLLGTLREAARRTLARPDLSIAGVLISALPLLGLLVIPSQIVIVYAAVGVSLPALAITRLSERAGQRTNSAPNAHAAAGDLHVIGASTSTANHHSPTRRVP